MKLCRNNDLSTLRVLLVFSLGLFSVSCSGGEKTPPKQYPSQYLPFDNTLIKDLESKQVKMVLTIDKDGKIVVVDTNGALLEDCRDKCTGLQNVTVRAIDNPIIFKTTRNPTCIIYWRSGQQIERCF